MSELSIINELRNIEAAAGGTLIGALAGLLSSYTQNRDAHDQRRWAGIGSLREDLDTLKKLVDSPAPQPLADLQRGILESTYAAVGNVLHPVARPPIWVGSEPLTYPPGVTERDANGVITKIGEMVRFGHRLGLPEVRAMIAGLQLFAEPTAEQIRWIVLTFASLMQVIIQNQGPLNPIAPLAPAQLTQMANFIAANPQGPEAMNNFWFGLLSQAGKAVMGGIGSVGTLNAAQTNAVVTYFNQLISGIIAVGGASAVSAWVAAACPAYADPALDAAWSFTYNPSTLLGTPAITSASLGGVVVNTAVVASTFFAFIADASEQQTARRFRMKFSNLSTAAPGQAARFFLPKALTNGTAPKVSVSVEGNTWAQAGYPYIKNVTGGALPYFDVYVVAGTNSADWYLILDVSR